MTRSSYGRTRYELVPHGQGPRPSDSCGLRVQRMAYASALGSREFGNRKSGVSSLESGPLISLLGCLRICTVPSPVLLTPDSRDSVGPGVLLSHLARHTGTLLAAGGVSAIFEITLVPCEIFVSGAGAWKKAWVLDIQ